ncbi:hypothetical protein OG339_14145 [Streptosporangium sp. NBC_01495]|uniref:hypothetical protein n=1 Tax=Streptosporangium sp. NBC_01495 TaxID=2903899 RepID=UPI002E34826A|nr:hypothetical protein [Streptosporangium sp. NBC_01495]
MSLSVRPIVRNLLLVLALVTSLMTFQATAGVSSAHASDCERVPPVAGAVYCGVVHNKTPYKLVAASYDLKGGNCNGTDCGTCAVPAGSNSTAACGRLFKDTDAVTFPSRAWYFKGVRKSANQYAKIDSMTVLDCRGSGTPQCTEKS